MGDLLRDNSRNRLERAFATTLQLYEHGGVEIALGVLDFVQEVALRRIERVDAYYDSEPLQFDDLIEVQTGGDQACIVLAQLNQPVTAFGFLPQTRLLPDQVISKIRCGLDLLDGVRHIIPIQVDTDLEHEALYRWRYRPVSPFRPAVRFYCPEQYFSEIMDLGVEIEPDDDPEWDEEPAYEF